MRIKTTREKRILIVKTVFRWFLYLLIMLICFVSMNAGTFIKPILLIPVAVCISSNTGELQAAFIGSACGFMIDLSCDKLLGYNAVILCVFCVITSLCYSRLLRNRLINAIIITALISLIQGVLDYNFYYDIWGYDDSSLILKHYTMPVILLTIASAFVIYAVFHLINKFLMPKPHLTIEEAIKNFEE
ncbi:MAG: hypothetical protein IKL31_01520 [Ruminococcus sp.]|nr:hypothetical protein [Ruminococcus sp.]